MAVDWKRRSVLKSCAISLQQWWWSWSWSGWCGVRSRVAGPGLPRVWVGVVGASRGAVHMKANERESGAAGHQPNPTITRAGATDTATDTAGPGKQNHAPDEALEGELADEELRRLLELADFAERNRACPEPVVPGGWGMDR